MSFSLSCLWVLSFATLILTPFTSKALDVETKVKTLRIANSITGGLMPTTDPLFQEMLVKVQSGKLREAAEIAAQSKYFGAYLGRRLAIQMQNPSLSPDGTDNDATTFIVAHFTGSGTNKPSISELWCDNATYFVNVDNREFRFASIPKEQRANINWNTDLVRKEGQTAKSPAGEMVTIPKKHVGGYVTLSDGPGDNSFAMWGATAGTNLRMIEGIWQISTGLSLIDVASLNGDLNVVPRFIPEKDPNFLKGTGQPACIACHAGGFASLNHGYSTVADIFDFDAEKGFIFNPAPATKDRKSLSSDPAKRAENLLCDLNAKPVPPECNSKSLGVDPNQSWDVMATWGQTGTLSRMGWTGNTTGMGLNELGREIGKATIVYEFLTKRIVTEICPMGAFSKSEIEKIAKEANPFAKPSGTDDVRTLVALVASHESCQ